MSKFTTLALAVAAFALAFVTLAPSSADAGWRRGPGATVYVGPRSGWYGSRRHWRRYPYGYPYAYFPYWRNRYYYR
jgi:hypothetical protein